MHGCSASVMVRNDESSEHMRFPAAASLMTPSGWTRVTHIVVANCTLSGREGSAHIHTHAHVQVVVYVGISCEWRQTLTETETYMVVRERRRLGARTHTHIHTQRHAYLWPNGGALFGCA